MENRREVAILGGGCFWCLEAVYERLSGVESVVSGYCGGHLASPTYHEICAGQSGHAEVVKVCFDTAQIGYREILDVFFAIHDPTTLDRQGHDAGTQYRSVIFYQSDEQRQIAEVLIDELNESGEWGAKLVTQVVAAAAFHPAEDYHQHYFGNNRNQSYCQFVITPKLSAFRSRFADRLKSGE